MTILKIGVPPEQLGGAQPPARPPLPPIESKPRVPRKKAAVVKHG